MSAATGITADDHTCVMGRARGKGPFHQGVTSNSFSPNLKLMGNTRDAEDEGAHSQGPGNKNKPCSETPGLGCSQQLQSSSGGRCALRRHIVKVFTVVAFSLKRL